MNENQLDQNADAASVTSCAGNEQRQKNQRQIVIETLRSMCDMKPTRDQLQKLAHIRRKRFIVVLKDLLSNGEVERTGTGTKKDPYLYRLAKL